MLKFKQYLDEQEPWFTIKSDPDKASRSIYTALHAIDSLKIIFSPFLPFSSEKLHNYMGYDGTIFGNQYTRNVVGEEFSYDVLEYVSENDIGKWEQSVLSQGHSLRNPSPLFKKLDKEIVTQEMNRLGD